MGILDDAIREHLELKRRRGADGAEVSRQEREILGGAEGGEAAYAAPADDYDAGYDEPLETEAPYATADADADLFDDPVAEPLAGSPLAEPEGAIPPASEPVPGLSPTAAADELFPGTGELLAASQEAAPAPAPAPTPVERPASPALGAPAPAGADSETAARSGARRLSDEELAAWRRRLSERADRLAAQRPGTSAAPTTGADSAASVAPRATPADQPVRGEDPPAYWSGNSAAAAPSTPAGGAPTPDGEPRLSRDFFDAGDAESAFAPEAAPEPTPDPDHDVLDETPDFLQETPEHDRMWFEQRPPRDFDFG